jgi:hypothetical protein
MWFIDVPLGCADTQPPQRRYRQPHTRRLAIDHHCRHALDAVFARQHQTLARVGHPLLQGRSHALHPLLRDALGLCFVGRQPLRQLRLEPLQRVELVHRGRADVGQRNPRVCEDLDLHRRRRAALSRCDVRRTYRLCRDVKRQRRDAGGENKTPRIAPRHATPHPRAPSISRATQCAASSSLHP